MCHTWVHETYAALYTTFPRNDFESIDRHRICTSLAFIDITWNILRCYEKTRDHMYYDIYCKVRCATVLSNTSEIYALYVPLYLRIELFRFQDWKFWSISCASPILCVCQINCSNVIKLFYRLNSPQQERFFCFTFLDPDTLHSTVSHAHPPPPQACYCVLLNYFSKF
jgi:hypothetical protein